MSHCVGSDPHPLGGPGLLLLFAARPFFFNGARAHIICTMNVGGYLSILLYVRGERTPAVVTWNGTLADKIPGKRMGQMGPVHTSEAIEIYNIKFIHLGAHS